jgi:hypothetical protein
VLSSSRTSGTAGGNFEVTNNSSGTFTGTSYNGSVIWSKAPLTTW